MRFYFSLMIFIFASGVSCGQNDALTLNEFDQFNRGVQYEKGFGVQQNYDAAVVWYAKAAKQGNAKAQNSLGVMYATGRGVLENDKTAVIWFTKAAEQGNKAAQNNLGFMYAEGEGVLSNKVKAYMWWRLAILNGSKDAVEKKVSISRYMSNEQIARAQGLVQQCLVRNYRDC